MSTAAMPPKGRLWLCSCAASPVRPRSCLCLLFRTATTAAPTLTLSRMRGRKRRGRVDSAGGGMPMSALRYTRDHEWVRIDGDLVVVGISDYAQSQLGDVVYVELPEIGCRVEQGKEAAVVESVKAASEVY